MENPSALLRHLLNGGLEPCRFGSVVHHPSGFVTLTPIQQPLSGSVNNAQGAAQVNAVPRHSYAFNLHYQIKPLTTVARITASEIDSLLQLEDRSAVVDIPRPQPDVEKGENDMTPDVSRDLVVEAPLEHGTVTEEMESPREVQQVSQTTLIPIGNKKEEETPTEEAPVEHAVRTDGEVHQIIPTSVIPDKNSYSERIEQLEVTCSSRNYDNEYQQHQQSIMIIIIFIIWLIPVLIKKGTVKLQDLQYSWSSFGAKRQIRRSQHPSAEHPPPLSPRSAVSVFACVSVLYAFAALIFCVPTARGHQPLIDRTPDIFATGERPFARKN